MGSQTCKVQAESTGRAEQNKEARRPVELRYTRAH